LIYFDWVYKNGLDGLWAILQANILISEQP
jgi:hypothetical protein